MTNYKEKTLTMDGYPEDKMRFWNFPAEAAEFFLHEDVSPIVSDLEERTSRFGERIILSAKKITWKSVNNRLSDQLVGAGTSVGANYGEADDGFSRPDPDSHALNSSFVICHSP